MALFCIISEIKRDIVRKSRFFTRLALDAPLGARSPRVAVPFGVEKLEWCGYPMMKMFDMFSRFDRIPACDRQTDRRTDILRRHSLRYV